MDFDPYATWLGIPADRRPPTYYDLLGVAVDEPDPAAIEQAALRRMSKVRQQQIGPYSDLSQEVLSELARARLILMDPDRRAEYDATLQARDESHPAPWTDLEKDEARVQPRRRRRPDENAADSLGSLVIVDPERNARPTLRPSTTKAPPARKNRVVIGTALAAHAAIIGGTLFYFFGWPSVREAPPNLLRNERVSPKRLAPTPPGKFAWENRGQPHPRAWPPTTTRPSPESKQPEPRREMEPLKEDAVASRENSNQDDEQKASEPREAPEDVLTKHGLKLADSTYVLEGEAEAREKAAETRRLYNELRIAMRKQEATVSPEARQQAIQNLVDEIDQCRRDMRDADQAMRQIPRYFHHSFANPDDAALHATLFARRDQTKVYVDMAAEYLKRLRREPFDPAARARADAMVRQSRDSYDQTRDELWKVVETTDQKYRELAKNPEIKKALDAIRSKTKARRDLGPTREFKNTAEAVARAKKDAVRAEKAKGRRRPS